MAGPGGIINLSDGDDHFPNPGDNNTGNESVFAMNGNDTVQTGIGDDSIDGGGGNDDLLGDAGNDFISGGEGNDTIQGGDGNDNITDFGGRFSFIDGGAGNDYIQMSTGFQPGSVINGSTGYDILVTGNQVSLAAITVSGFEELNTFGVRVTATAGQFESFAIIRQSGEGGGSPVNLSLPGLVPGPQFLNLAGELNAQGGRAAILRGSSSDDRLYTGFGDDSMSGLAGNDKLYGLIGNDTLIGGNGADTLSGSLGNDRLIGGAGGDQMNGHEDADIFVYQSIADTGVTGADRDTIGGFTHAADRIDLHAIDAVPGGVNDKFSFVGTGPVTGIGQVHLVQSGVNTLVELNIAGDATPEAVILLVKVTAAALTPGDFIL